MKHQDTELTKMEAIVILLDLGRTADERTCRAAMLGAKALARHLKHKAACHASRVARGLPARQAQKKKQEETSHGTTLSSSASPPSAPASTDTSKATAPDSSREYARRNGNGQQADNSKGSRR